MTAADAWQPIASAPHNVPVILFIPATVHTAAYQEIGLASGGTRYPNGASSMWFHGHATHWQPLPAPPRDGDG